MWYLFKELYHFGLLAVFKPFEGINLQEYRKQSDAEDIYIVTILSEEHIDIAKRQGLPKKFKLTNWTNKYALAWPGWQHSEV